MGLFSHEKIIGGGKPNGFYGGCYRDPKSRERGPEIWLPWFDPVLIIGRNRVGKDTGIIAVATGLSQVVPIVGPILLHKGIEQLEKAGWVRPEAQGESNANNLALAIFDSAAKGDMKGMVENVRNAETKDLIEVFAPGPKGLKMAQGMVNPADIDATIAAAREALKHC